MSNVWLLSGISWHFECVKLAWDEIDSFKPPANGFHMRMHYSLWLTNLLSAIDLLRDSLEQHTKSQFITALKDSLKTSDFSGEHVYNYIRELRNGIVHRGIDPTSGGMVVNGVCCAISPRVDHRDGKQSYAAPTNLLRDLFSHCEISAKPIIRHFLELEINKLATAKPKAMHDDYLRELESISHMPDWAKEMSRKHVRPEMLVRAQTDQIEKLYELLKPRAGKRIP